MAIQLATANDLEWINAQYQKIDFVPSSLDNEIIAIVTYNDELAGLFTSMMMKSKLGEFIYWMSLEDYLANELVGYLVETAKKKNLKEVYCLPFEELRNFYAKFDFHEFEYEDSQVNAKVLEKFKWCLGNYEKQSFTIEAN